MDLIQALVAMRTHMRQDLIEDFEPFSNIDGEWEIKAYAKDDALPIIAKDTGLEIVNTTRTVNPVTGQVLHYYGTVESEGVIIKGWYKA